MMAHERSCIQQSPTLFEQVTNAGNVDLEMVVVSDPTVVHDCGVVVDLGVGNSFTCAGNYSLSWLDINAHRRENAVT